MPETEGAGGEAARLERVELEVRNCRLGIAKLWE